MELSAQKNTPSDEPKDSSSEGVFFCFGCHLFSVGKVLRIRRVIMRFTFSTRMRDGANHI